MQITVPGVMGVFMHIIGLPKKKMGAFSLDGLYLNQYGLKRKNILCMYIKCSRTFLNSMKYFEGI